jgi:hypothetical protein
MCGGKDDLKYVNGTIEAILAEMRYALVIDHLFPTSPAH